MWNEAKGSRLTELTGIEGWKSFKVLIQIHFQAKPNLVKIVQAFGDLSRLLGFAEGG